MRADSRRIRHAGRACHRIKIRQFTGSKKTHRVAQRRYWRCGPCRFDVRWHHTGYYNFHHTDKQDVNFRFDYHPKSDAPNKHFHPPPDASSYHPQQSCISTTEPRLMTRAVHFLWRRAYEKNLLTRLNEAKNQP